MVILFILAVFGLSELYDQLQEQSKTRYILPAGLQPISDEYQNGSLNQPMDWLDSDEKANPIGKTTTVGLFKDEHLFPTRNELCNISNQPNLDDRIEKLEKV